MTLLTILFLTLIGSLLSLFGGMTLLLKKSWGHGFALVLTSFAAGVLLSTAFLDLFPEALEHLWEIGATDVFTPALFGIVFFFLLERTFIWFHHHHDDAHGIQPTVWMIIIGDGVHNFIDGVAIAATFMANPALGLTTALAVAAHEIPQEIADFSILLSKGFSRAKALAFNIASALTAFGGAILMYIFSESLEASLGFIIAFTGGMFSYIALSDLIPELHHSHSTKGTLYQIMAFIFGILIMVAVKTTLGQAIH